MIQSHSKVIDSPHWRQYRIDPRATISEYCTIHQSVVGAGAYITERVSLRRCVIAPGAFVNAGSVLENVCLGRSAQVGPLCALMGVWHIIGDDGPEFAHTPAKEGRIVIGEKTLIGASTTIVPGVVIGKRCVIAAGALVTKNIGDETVYLGRAPHPVMMSLSEYRARKKLR